MGSSLAAPRVQSAFAHRRRSERLFLIRMASNRPTAVIGDAAGGPAVAFSRASPWKSWPRRGGVTNHRMGLYDAILIKNNHISAAGGVRNALERARTSGLPIEIEVRTREELHKALDCGATHLLLDNLTPDEAADWIREIAGRAKVELSGGITLENVRDYADVGADFVSSGAITHSARAMDLSFRLELI